MNIRGLVKDKDSDVAAVIYLTILTSVARLLV